MSFKAKIMAITPLSCVIIFLSLGFLKGLWVESLPVFLLIPIMPFLLGYKKIRLTVSFVILIIYLILGFGFQAWHPGWIVFLFIPIVHILMTPSKKSNWKFKSTHIDADGDDF